MDEFDKLEAEFKNSVSNAEDAARLVLARLLLVRQNWVEIKKRFEIMDKEDKKNKEKIALLEELVIKQTETAVMLDPLRKVEYWQRLNDAGFYDNDDGC